MEISQKGAAHQLLMTTQVRVCFRRNCQRNFLHRRNVTKAGAQSSSYANLQNRSCNKNPAHGLQNPKKSHAKFKA
jgi:hypothetical protein